MTPSSISMALLVVELIKTLPMSSTKSLIHQKKSNDPIARARLVIDATGKETFPFQIMAYTHTASIEITSHVPQPTRLISRQDAKDASFCVSHVSTLVPFEDADHPRAVET